MRDYLSIGCVPCDEDCQQVGTASYDPRKARAECRAFAHQLERVAERAGRAIPPGASFGITSNPHDFGPYLDVVVRYDDQDEVGAAFAFWLESVMPENWDDEARAELGEAGVEVKEKEWR